MSFLYSGMSRGTHKPQQVTTPQRILQLNVHVSAHAGTLTRPSLVYNIIYNLIYNLIYNIIYKNRYGVLNSLQGDKRP